MKIKQLRNRCDLDTLNDGFRRFYYEYGHYPSTDEVDNCKYLCSSKQIQRKFGGINKLRELLGIHDSDYSRGSHRKIIYERINRLGISSEHQISDFLKHRYGDICVHEERKYGTGRNRVDFYVFAKTNFAVEVFNTYTLRNLLINLNSKLKKYKNFSDLIFFVVTGANFNQTDIDSIIDRKKNKKYLAINIKCVSLDGFKKHCQDIQPLKVEVPIQASIFNQ